jgi:hypothetical protein
MRDRRNGKHFSWRNGRPLAAAAEVVAPVKMTVVADNMSDFEIAQAAATLLAQSLIWPWSQRTLGESERTSFSDCADVCSADLACIA